MFKIIDVIFRPVEHLPYDDFIYVKMLDGIEGNGFHVPVRATIDKLILQAPPGLDFGYCPTHQVTTKYVCVRELIADFLPTYIHIYIHTYTYIHIHTYQSIEPYQSTYIHTLLLCHIY